MDSFFASIRRDIHEIAHLDTSRKYLLSALFSFLFLSSMLVSYSLTHLSPQTRFIDAQTNQAAPASSKKVFHELKTRFNIKNQSAKKITELKTRLCPTRESNCIEKKEQINIPQGASESTVQLFSNLENKKYDLSYALAYEDGSESTLSARAAAATGDPIIVDSTVSEDGSVENDISTLITNLDLNSDGFVTVFDAAIFVKNEEYGTCNENLNFDIDGDGCVNALDTSIFYPYLDVSVQ